MKNTKFNSRKDKFFVLIIVSAIILLLGLPVYQYFVSGFHPGIAIIAINVGLCLFFAWSWLGTYYTIDETHVHYRSGPFRGKIPILAINEVRLNTTKWVGFRPALARKGLTLKYNKYDDIYFSPASNEAFIAALLDIKPDIRVTRD